MDNIDIIRPIYNIDEDKLKMISKIEKKLSHLHINKENRIKRLRHKSKVKSIYSSLAIEDNSLSLKKVVKIIDNQIVLGKKDEIQEVKNANELYKNINNYNWRSEEDFLKAKKLMMRFFDDEGYRNHGEGVESGRELVYQAPDSILVPNLMKSLFTFINMNEGKLHPLILSSIFHYYFVAIHPFSDGNGRMARFWVNLMLIDYNKKFEYLPIEEEILHHQKEYYEAIMQCHINKNVNIFIDFMLKIIYETINKVTKKSYFLMIRR